MKANDFTLVYYVCLQLKIALYLYLVFFSSLFSSSSPFSRRNFILCYPCSPSRSVSRRNYEVCLLSLYCLFYLQVLRSLKLELSNVRLKNAVLTNYFNIVSEVFLASLHYYYIFFETISQSFVSCKGSGDGKLTDAHCGDSAKCHIL